MSRGKAKRSASIRDSDIRSSSRSRIRVASPNMIATKRWRVSASTASSSCRVSMNPSKVASGVLSSCEALATKSTRICSAARAWLWSARRTSRLPSGKRRDAHLPGPAELAEADQLDPDRRRAAVAGERLGRGRVADGEADVRALDMGAEQQPWPPRWRSARAGRARPAAAPRTPRADSRRPSGAAVVDLGAGSGRRLGRRGARASARRPTSPGEQGEQGRGRGRAGPQGGGDAQRRRRRPPRSPGSFSYPPCLRPSHGGTPLPFRSPRGALYP